MLLNFHTGMKLSVVRTRIASLPNPVRSKVYLKGTKYVEACSYRTLAPRSETDEINNFISVLTAFPAKYSASTNQNHSQEHNLNGK